MRFLTRCLARLVWRLYVRDTADDVEIRGLFEWFEEIGATR